jgi:ribosome-binding ATPase YchF (GTP1/OBG family)
VSAKLETELCSVEDRVEYLRSLGVEDTESIMDSLSHNFLPTIAIQLLGMTLAYTGPGVPPERSKTTRTHLFTRGLTAEGLAGRIHGKIEKGFIRAEVTPASILLGQENLVTARESGVIRTEGRDYKLETEDVVLIKWK